MYSSAPAFCRTIAAGAISLCMLPAQLLLPARSSPVDCAAAPAADAKDLRSSGKLKLTQVRQELRTPMVSVFCCS